MVLLSSFHECMEQLVNLPAPLFGLWSFIFLTLNVPGLGFALLGR